MATVFCMDMSPSNLFTIVNAVVSLPLKEFDFIKISGQVGQRMSCLEAMMRNSGNSAMGFCQGKCTGKCSSKMTPIFSRYYAN